MRKEDRKIRATRRAIVRRASADQKVRACACGAVFTPRCIGLLRISQCPECWPKAIAKHRERHEAGLAGGCIPEACPLREEVA